MYNMKVHFGDEYRKDGYSKVDINENKNINLNLPMQDRVKLVEQRLKEFNLIDTEYVESQHIK